MKYRVLVMASLMTTMGVCAAASTPALQSEKDKFSYSVGVMTGRAYRSHNVDINPQVYTQGFQDAMSGSKLKLSEQEITGALKKFQQKAQAKAKSKQTLSAQQNLKAGQAFLAANKLKPGVTTLKSGLQFKVLTPGKGPHPKLTDMVTVNYEGTLVNGTIFDSSYQRNKSVTFPVNGVIAGWTEALQLMSKGATWMLYIPADLAYGSNGPGKIGPNQTLIFKVNLIDFKSSPPAQQ